MWKRFFLPHPQTHKKAHLLSWEAFVIYILLFALLHVSFNVLSNFKPGILGISSNINKQLLIELTNKERNFRNLPTLNENPMLDLAAAAKAQNMFEEDYWAHFSPSGKDPWGFILKGGYRFSYAGENLARNFYVSQDVVSAWMASPSHRENILNPKYKDIGIAAVEGILKGQKTTLVVQMFGTPIGAITENINLGLTPSRVTAIPQESLTNIGGQTIALMIDPYRVSKLAGSAFLVMLAMLLVVDLYVIRQRAVVRITSRHLSHLAMIGLVIGALYSMNPGVIL